ncbi:MAG: hypothetical protein ACOC2N_08070 [Spirochaetota bacterium]
MQHKRRIDAGVHLTHYAGVTAPTNFSGRRAKNGRNAFIPYPAENIRPQLVAVGVAVRGVPNAPAAAALVGVSPTRMKAWLKDTGPSMPAAVGIRLEHMLSIVELAQRAGDIGEVVSTADCERIAEMHLLRIQQEIEGARTK